MSTPTPDKLFWKLTSPQLTALKYARDDVVLLVPKPGTWGSSDTRDDVQVSVVKRLMRRGMLKLDISHGDDNALGVTLTPLGLQYLQAQLPGGI
jgi:hypothetical protein